MVTSSTSGGAVAAFHRSLLPGTLSNAVRTPFYRALWSGVDLASIKETEDLVRLPEVDKDMLRQAGRDAQFRVGLVCQEVFTSGTTGPPLVTSRGNREQAFINEFFSALADFSSDHLWRRGLQFNNPYHGHLVAVPAPIHFHKVGIYDAGSFDHARRVLTELHDDVGIEPRCTLLVGLERMLRAFTADTAALVEDHFETSLEAVVSYSQYLTQSARAELTRVWRVPLIDRYSLAELFGGASSCLTCGWWHPDPFLIVEVVGHRSRRSVEEGLGILLLTSLYPFQEAQPMVRYDTRDVVEVTHRSCRLGEAAFRPLGRARFGIPEPEGDGWLITPVTPLEVLDGREEVARIPRFCDSAQVQDPYRIGHPRYRLLSEPMGNGKAMIVLRVQVPLHDSSSRATQKSWTESVEAELIASSPALKASLAKGSAELRIEPVNEVEGDLVSHSD